LQRFFAQLSVFGGWTTEAARAVCEEPQAKDYLARLRETPKEIQRMSRQRKPELPV